MDKILYKEGKIAIYRSATKGFCVMSAVDLKPKEFITVCPVSLMEVGDIKGTSLLDVYPMGWSKKNDCIAFGVINLLNHSKNSNITLKRDKKNHLIRAYAKGNIKKGEELTINYICKLWFKPLEEKLFVKVD
jgi:hypothetical protein